MHPLLSLRGLSRRTPSLPLRRLSSTHSQSSNRLAGRTCMITGASSGIGYAIARRFLREGAARLILVGRSHERLVGAAARLENGSSNDAPKESAATQHQDEDHPAGSLIESSNRIHLLVGDVSVAESWLRELEKAMSTTDILINAAGISNSAILPKTEPTEISHVLRTNLQGAILTSRALIRAAIRGRMKNRSSASSSASNSDPTSNTNTHPKSKCIINISSLLALKGGTGAVPYAASKAGLLGLTRSVAVETAASLRDVAVRSNAIVPGYIETPMISDFSAGENTRLKESIPLRRFGRPEEVADAAVFLAGNEYANNCVINLDGGLSGV